MFESQFSKEFKNLKIRKKIRDIEPQEILLDSLAKKKEEEIGISEKKIELPLSKNVLLGFLTFIFILFSFLFIKAFQLQLIEGKKFSLLADQNKFKIHQIQAERGVIYDKNYNQLVWNSASFDLLLAVKELPPNEIERLRIFRELSIILKKPLEEIKKQIENSIVSSKSSDILVQENIDSLTLVLLETKIDSQELPGFKIKKNFTRHYKTEPNLSHLIGYLAKISEEELKAEPEEYSIFDLTGKSGLEKSYEKILRRNPGKLRLEKDARGNLISQEIIQVPEPGKSLVLWLDSQLQEKVREELEKQLKISGAEKGVVVALDPKTGGVLAMVSLPDFDNNSFQNFLTDQRQPLFNRAISGLYPIGSIIKPLIASAALEEKIISPTKRIYDSGKITVPHRYNPKIVYTFKDWKIHGWVDLNKALAESCNVYFYTIGGGYKDQEGLGASRIKKYLELFGWGNKTQIDLPEEKEGFIPSPEWKKEIKKENWYDGDTYHLSIGQGDIQITPLQVASSFAVFANGGKLLKPKVVQKIIDTSTGSRQVIEEFKPEIIRENFISPENLQIVREGMRQVISSPSGTAHSLNSLPVSVAGKTGTAQASKKGNHNWIAVFAPYEDPKIVLTVMIEDVEAWGAAIPVAKRILEWYFQK